MEFHAAFWVSNLAFDCVAVPPFGIDPCGNEAYNECSMVSGFSIGLAHPSTNFSAIRWVHKDALFSPALLEAVFSRRVVLCALSRFVVTTRVESEAELQVEVFKPIGRSCPSHIFT